MSTIVSAPATLSVPQCVKARTGMMTLRSTLVRQLLEWTSLQAEAAKEDNVSPTERKLIACEPTRRLTTRFLCSRITYT